MNEKDLRKWHRYLGISPAFFLILQAGSGLSISLGHLTAGHIHEKPGHSDAHDKQKGSGGHTHNSPEKHSTDGSAVVSAISGFFTDIHHGGGTAGSVYRIVLAIGILLQAASGSLIFFTTRSRSKKRPSKKR